MEYEFLSLEFNSTDPDALTISDYDLAGFDVTRFLTGELIRDFPEDFRIHVDGNRGNLVNNSFSVHIVSELLGKLLLDHFNSEIELVPAPLFTKAGEKIEGYFVLNCLNIVDCSDWKNSVYSKDDETDTTIVFDVAIDSDKVPDDVSIFRVAQASNSDVFLRMRLYERFKQSRGFFDIKLIGAKSSCNAELLDARSKANQAALNEEQECIQLIKQARELLKQNRSQEVMEGLVLARQAAAMSSIRLDVRVVAMVQLEVALRRCREYLEALQVCESCLADPDMIQAKVMFERSAALCEWRLGKIDQAIARLKNSLSEEENEHIRNLLLEIESAKSAE